MNYVKVLRQRAFIMVAIFLATISTLAPAQDLQHGIKNYQEIMGGRKKLEQLSPEEKQEVFTIHRRVEASRARSTGSSECRDARDQAERSASELSDYARRLRNCAEARDFSDDCSTELRRTRNAHSDYETAVSSVGSYCQ